jgi:hypothetical protein
MYTCTHVHMYTCTHVHIYTCTHVHMYTSTHVHIYTCTHVHPIIPFPYFVYLIQIFYITKSAGWQRMKSFRVLQIWKVKSYCVCARCLREQNPFASARKFYLHKLTSGSSLQNKKEKELNSKWICNEETVFFQVLSKTERDKEKSNADVWIGTVWT